MAPDKSWMELVDDDRLNPTYATGVKKFLEFAFNRTGEKYEIRCPCKKCCNSHSRTRDEIETHLLVYGILRGYTFWYHHGERLGEPQSGSDGEDESGSDGEDNDKSEKDIQSDDEIEEMVRDLFPSFTDFDRNNAGNGFSSQDTLFEDEPNSVATKFYRLLRDSAQSVYQGSKCSKLSALVKLLHMKSLGRWSNKSFTMLLQYLKEELLPDGAVLPDSYDEAKKIIRDLGCSYEKIDACVNNCMLYWKDDKNFDFCKICGTSRWKNDKVNGEIKHKENGKRIPSKILRYFPLKPRLQRLFMSTKIASHMRWHHDKRIDDNVMRHPADSKAWKDFDRLHDSFSSESRNVRLGLASDGFQPFANMRTSYSIWPVILIPYNLPPWMCMKPSNMILSTLIPGPESPGDAIDIYLQPLIEELKELWEVGVETYDASRKQNFNLHAAMLWTINDFPAYGNLSGWSTKGKLACPCCNKDTHSIRLANGGKQCYMGHRRYLPINHRWRNDKDSFDGTKERGLPPMEFSGDDILIQVQDLEGISLSKAPGKKTKLSHGIRGDNWNKKSIFFELPYWRTLLLRHNLDVMHIEKNICHNVLGTIMDIKGKTKDNIKTRLDLQAMGIRRELHPIEIGNKHILPTASYTLSSNEKHILCQFLKQLKVPDGFSSNISHCVNLKERKISGLKSHDCHILLQRLIPLAIRSLLPKKVCEPLIELSLFFTTLCAKTLRMNELKQIEAQIPITLCKLERIFPPSFFDIMMHLPIHLASEALIGGPVQFRWMYPIERQLYRLKSYVRNRARPEGSIAEGYIADECTTLCSRYLHSIETTFNRIERNYDGGISKPCGELSIFRQTGRTLGASNIRDLDIREWEQAHIYVLRNCVEVQTFIDEYDQTCPPHRIQTNSQAWNRNFIEWFRTKVSKLDKEGKVDKEMLALARGPSNSVKCFSGLIINGFRFHTEGREKRLRTQNSGVVVVGDIGSKSGNIDYYGVLTEIIELEYLEARSVLLLRCKWWDVYDEEKGVKVDEYGFVSINCKRFLKTNEPFVLAKQASQVFYVTDTVNKGWCIMLKTQPRGSYEMPIEDDQEDLDNPVEAFQQDSSINLDYVASTSLVDDEIAWSRRDVELRIVDLASSTKKKKGQLQEDDDISIDDEDI